MLNEFAGIQKVSDESLGRDKNAASYQPRNLNSSQVLDNFYYIIFSFVYFPEIRTYRLYLVNLERNKFLYQTNISKK